MNDAKKILVVEDDDVARELVRMALERKGYIVVTAEDGLRGYDAAVSVRPDLIITDVNMPAATACIWCGACATRRTSRKFQS